MDNLRAACQDIKKQGESNWRQLMSSSHHQECPDELESRDESSRFPGGETGTRRALSACRFVVLDDGRLVTDAASFDELTSVLAQIGKDRPDVFVVQVGVDYPEEVFILI